MVGTMFADGAEWAGQVSDNGGDSTFRRSTDLTMVGQEVCGFGEHVQQVLHAKGCVQRFLGLRELIAFNHKLHIGLA